MAENPATWNEDVKAIFEACRPQPPEDGSFGASMYVQIEQAVVAPLRAEIAELRETIARREALLDKYNAGNEVMNGWLGEAVAQAARGRAAIEALRERVHTRAEGQREFLLAHCPQVFAEQKHLEEGSVERAYWHYGSQSALADAVAQIDAILKHAAGIGAQAAAEKASE